MLQRATARYFSANPVPMSVHEPDAHIQYAKIKKLAAEASTKLGRPLTYAEKVLFGHLDSKENAANIVKGDTYINLRPDRVAMQDASAPGAVLQFISSGLPRSAVPATIHCDHLIVAKDSDTKV